MSSRISYRIEPIYPAAHLFEIQLTISEPDPMGQGLTLPAWIPGSYMIRDFARNIVSLHAEQDGTRIEITKTDKQTWRLLPVRGEVLIVYQVYAWDLSVRSAYLDETRAYFNGTSVFLRVIGQENTPHRVSLIPPNGERYADWRVATTLPAKQVDARGLGLYEAVDYESLIDCPVEFSPYASAEFRVDGVPHEMVISGRQCCDMARLTDDLARICSQHAKVIGELPVERYVFMTMVTADGYGGLEHRDSTSLMCSRADLPRLGLTDPDEGYRRFLGLCSHEYFHLWNVKRIRPEQLKQADLRGESYTRLLWAFEGFTSYYDDLALVRAGCIDAKSYLELLAQTITRVQRSGGRFRQSVAESSFDAWTKFYKQDENAPNAIVSYYTKGAMIAFGLDVLLRDASADTVNLDDLMRLLWQRYGKPDIGVPEDGIVRLVNELTGCDVSEFFARFIEGMDELPLAEWLASVGVGFALRPALDANDQGASSDAAPDHVDAKRVIGARWVADNGFARLTHVLDGGAAQIAGLAAGDLLIALDGLHLPADKVAQRIDRALPDQPVTLHAFRRDELMVFNLMPLPAPADTAVLWLLPADQLTDGQRRRRNAWLGQDSC